MRVCKRHNEPAARGIALGLPGSILRLLAITLCLLLLSACSEQRSAGRLVVEQVDSRWLDGQLLVRLQQDIQLSDEARRAINNGVPLTIETTLVLKGGDRGREIADSSQHFEIRYLPLSNLYQLTRGQKNQTFPRLRHLLAEIARSSHVLLTDEIPDAQTRIRVRSRLDKQELPPPMRLPALFSAAWRHHSPWSEWPVDGGSSS